MDVSTKKNQKLASALQLYMPLLLSGAILSCASKPSSEVKAEATTKDTILSKSDVDLNLYPMTTTVCDPFNQQTVNNYRHGIKANLFYKTASMPRYYSSKDYVEKTWLSDQNLFFSQMNVPTRMFNTGFKSETGDVLKTDAGEKLIEYFGVKFESSLTLSDNDEEGLYDVALLSDDGSVMSLIPKPGTEKILIDNDGDHPTRMGCANQYLDMKRGQKKNFVVTYYQGPRYHIANVMIWRKVASTTTPKDASCGLTGNETFFDPNNNSAPRPAFNSLLSRGWKIVAPANFILEQIRDYNPCVDTVPPVITNFRLNETTIAEAWFSWNTDLEASSQLLITQVNDSSVVLTSSDNNLRTSHDLHITGLKPGTTYKAKAISIGKDLGRGESAEVVFTTP